MLRLLARRRLPFCTLSHPEQLTFLLPRNNPLIPIGETEMHLSHAKSNFLRLMKPTHLTTVTKRADASGEDPGSLFYEMGTLCQAEFPDNSNSVKLKTLHRVRISNVKKQILTIAEKPQGPEAVNPLQKLKAKTEKSEDVIFSAELQKVELPVFQADLHHQNKLKFILTLFAGINKYQGLKLNTHNTRNLFDQILLQLSQINLLKPVLLQEAFEAIEFDDCCEKVQKLIHVFNIYAKELSEIERTAQMRIKDKKYREFYNEIMKLAKDKAQGKRGKELFIENMTQQFLSKNPPKEVMQIFAAELDRYLHTQEQSMDYAQIKTYIEWTASLPFSVASQEKFDLAEARQVLDSQHFGMKEPKQKIMEYIAVGKLKGSLKGKVLCFIGPPGVGKTTFASSIAKALGRKFVQISLGGVNDSTALKGHRKTYIGAYPGKIIAALKEAKTNNPVILLDQIDKLGRSGQGDPRSELLQVLDPGMNNSFVDNYMQFAVDLSNVVFICSANDVRHISKPLMDRMEKVYLNSYTNDEKVGIFNQHIVRKVTSSIGLGSDEYELSPGLVQLIIRKYTRGEPGVRQLEKEARKLFQKITFKLVKDMQEAKSFNKLVIGQAELEEYLGPPKFTQKDRKLTPGVAYVLAETEYGGRLCAIETIKRSFSGNPQVAVKKGFISTGSLGEVIKQSIDIAYTFVRNFAFQHYKNSYLYDNEVHVHAPEGAVKKDGADSTLGVAVSLLSLALGQSLKRDVGLVGELTLKGHILPTKRLKEKILLAKRQGLRSVVVASGNRSEVSQLEEQLREGVSFTFVSDFKEVAEFLFSN